MTRSPRKTVLPAFASALTLCGAMLMAAAPAQAQTPAASAASETAASPTDAVQPARHAAWSELLSKYVRPAADGVNRFDYGALKADDADRTALTAYIASFETLDFASLIRDEAFAAWANLYNAVTIDHILGRYPVKSIRSGYIVGPWKEVSVMADGRELSLDAIEHDILRVEWSDPRVHYAVNCAAIGCPNLNPAAWEAATLDQALDTAARAYVNDPRGVTIRNNGLQVSRIYKWFREDFGGSNAGVIDHLKQYAEPDLLAQIEANPRIRRHAYDWDLNDAES
ncbi:MAG: DUF547 domain-containing protein [Pseudomonadota bacterium]